MSQNIISVETRIAKWQKYRQQIKEEAVLLQKINEKNKYIEKLENKITKIDSSIIIKNDSNDYLEWIPMKENDKIQTITKEIDNISSKFDEKGIKRIFDLFNKNYKGTTSPIIGDVREFELLFNKDTLSRELELIDKAVDSVEKEHNSQRLKLRQNKNRITDIISNQISGKKKKHIILSNDNIIYDPKISPKKIIMILVFLFLFFFIMTIIFIGLWFGGV